MNTVYATRRVLEGLGLDPDTGPLIEWRTPGPPEPTPATANHIGDTLLATGAGQTEIDLPAGVEPGDLLVLAMGTGGLAGSVPGCDDPRMVDVVVYPAVGLNAHQLVAYGFADDTLDPLSISLVDGENNGGAALSAYRITGVISTIVAHGNDTGADDITCEPAIPDGATLAVLALTGQIADHENPDGWTVDAEQHGSSMYATTWHSDSPPTVETFAHGWWLALTIGLADGAPPDVEIEWFTDVDRTRALISYQIGYGRADAVSKIAPLQVTVKAYAVWADPPEIGDPFRITLNDAAADVLGLTHEQAARFTGEITDVQLDPDTKTWTVIGVHQLARETRPTLDLTTAGPATIHDRVLEILSAIHADVGTIDAGGQTVAAPTDLAAASALLDLVSDSGPGQIVTQPNGLVDWHGRDHRRNIVSTLTLEAAEILSRITWAKHVGSVVNIATITYAGGQVTVTDSASVERRGPYTTSVSTALAAHDDAVSLGILIVGRRTIPAWAVPTLLLDVSRTVDLAHLADVFKARHSDRITVDGLPASGPIVGSFDFFLEGYAESAAPRSWQIGLSVTDPALSGVSIRWMDVDPELEWLEVDPALRWLDVARMEDPALLGTPAVTFDGGDSTTTGPYDPTFDGGDSTTTGPYGPTVDEGTAA